MEITIRTMLIVVVALIAVGIALLILVELSGSSGSSIKGLFDWIKGMMES